MGNSNSPLQRSRKPSSSSFRRQTSQLEEVARKIDEKECTFIAMQADIERAITEHNDQSMKSLASEIAAHIMDLNQLKKIDLPSGERGRSQRIIYNFEISLAKLKSILNSERVPKEFQNQESARFYIRQAAVDPDIVSDLIRFDSIDRYSQNRSTLPALSEGQELPAESTITTLTRNNSLYSKQAETDEDVFSSVENEFSVIKDQIERPIKNIEEYYQMDKGIFFLQVRLKNTNAQMNERKFKLIKELAEFRSLLDQKSGELEQQRDITQEINTLEMLVDSATEKELEGLKFRALEAQKIIENKTWEQNNNIINKIELLKRLGRVLERIAYSVSPAASLRHSVEHLYGNLNSLQEELDNLREREELESIEAIDKALSSEENEDIYGNADIIRQNLVTPQVQRSNSNLSQRGTVYVNADIVQQHSDIYDNYNVPPNNAFKSQEIIINKPPLPLPRNYDDKIVNDLPKHWQRLNEILDSEYLSETDKVEVGEIRIQAEIAKNLFERKIKRIMEKSEESVEL